jgi:SAM-dependent methyltransferase
MAAQFLETLSTWGRHIGGYIWQVHPIDRQLGVETSAEVPRRAQMSGHKMDKYAVKYQGLQPSILRKCLNLIGVTAEMTFIDIGCGKGRALMVAAEYPFRHIIGVELSEFILATARSNFKILGKKKPRYGDVELVHGDASHPPLDRGVNVLSFFNSFTGAPVHVLVEHVRQHLKTFPESEIWLICYNPVSFQAFDESGFLQRFYAAKLGFDPDEAAAGTPRGKAFSSVILYQSVGPHGREPMPGADAKVIATRLGCAHVVSSA